MLGLGHLGHKAKLGKLGISNQNHMTGYTESKSMPSTQNFDEVLLNPKGQKKHKLYLLQDISKIWTIGGYIQKVIKVFIFKSLGYLGHLGNMGKYDPRSLGIY